MKTLLLILVLVPMISVGQNVNIPDAIFKAYLVGEPLINTNGDSEIQISEASAFTGGVYCDGLGISDLSGIEAFTALTILWCEMNPLTFLDVSNNTNLTTLNCSFNQLTSLDVSSNIALEKLYCFNNQLISLDVSSNTFLTELYCGDNQLTSLDVSNNLFLGVFYSNNNQITSLDLSNNTILTELYCMFNQLTSLDVSSNIALTELSCPYNQLECLNVKNVNPSAITYFNTINNPNLTCIEVDNMNYSAVNWTNIDPQTWYSTDCNNACSNTSNNSELNNTPKQLIKIVDVLGRETPFKPNTPLLYIYNDGTVERKMIIKE